MNKLRFRAWDKSEKKMKRVYSIKFNEQGEAVSIQDEFADNYETYVTYDVKYYELLQSTGLFDKNGKEIYEGDIVKNEINEVGYIEWSKCRFNFCDSVGHFYLFSIGARQPFEILGNIYEHPHLLREE